MRTRHQDGWVEERGGRVRKWYGHYFEYVADEQGKETRRHRGLYLGDKAKMRKWAAEEKLRKEIAKSQKHIPVGDSLTFEWFTRERFLPMLQPKWAPSTRETNLGILNHHILPKLGSKPLSDLEKFDCQILLNDLAGKGFSFSVVDHCRIMIKAILEEALDADLIGKNVARKLANPETKEPQKPVLPKDKARELINALPLRDRLIAMIAAFCAMRPGEIFALQLSSFRGDHFYVQGTAWRGTMQPGKGKTKASLAPVVIPDVILPLLNAWLETMDNISPDSLLFPSTRPGIPMRPEVWLCRRVKPIARKLGITGKINFQVMRRTFATNAQEFGSAKSVQTHLRHTHVSTTLGVYTQAIPESVRKLVNDVANDVMTGVTPVTGRIQ